MSAINYQGINGYGLTPTPWKVVGLGDIVDANGSVVFDNKLLRVGPEVLAFTVLAVNNFHRMLTAMETARAQIIIIAGKRDVPDELTSAIAALEER